jgi:hypothetical protein
VSKSDIRGVLAFFLLIYSHIFLYFLKNSSIAELIIEFVTKTSAIAVANDCPADTDTFSLTLADWLANAATSRNRGSIYSCYDGAVWCGEIVTSRASNQGIVPFSFDFVTLIWRRSRLCST